MMQKIKTILITLRTWWKRQRTLAKFGMIAGVAVVLFVVLGKGGDTSMVIETVKRQDLVRSVAATGTVVSTTDLALSFQESNLVKSVNVSVGSRVRRGQVLATLSNASEAAAVASARGSLLAAEARYDKVVEGEDDEEIQRAEVDVENARRVLYSDDLVADPASNNFDDVAPVITGVYNGQTPGQYQLSIDRSINEIQYSGLEFGRLAISELPKPLGVRGLYLEFPDDGGYTIGSQWNIKIPNTSGENYAKNLNSFKAAEAALASKKATARSADIDIALADIASAKGSLASAQAEFEKTVIRAPADGTVTKVDLKLGELAETFAPVITLQDVSNLYIEANINESNISNIALGQPVSITYDAFGKGTVSTSTVTSIDLGATVVDGIVNYEVKAIIPDATNIRSGMTANISIQTAFAPNVLVIPDRVIVEKDRQKTVQVLVDERRQKTESRVITTGLRGDGGLIEVVSGLSDGEKVVFVSK